MKQKSIEGIVLKSTPLFDHDKRIELLTETEGKKVLLAKYANTKSFRFGSKLEVGNEIRCQIYKGNTFSIITECEFITLNTAIKNSFKKIAFQFYIIELIQKIAIENHKNKKLFELLKTTLQTLNNSEAPLDTLKETFQKKLLYYEGILDQEERELTDTEFNQYFQEYSEKKAPKLLQL